MLLLFIYCAEKENAGIGARTTVTGIVIMVIAIVAIAVVVTVAGIEKK